MQTMRRLCIFQFICVFCVICLLAGCAQATPRPVPPQTYYPTQAWRATTPEAQGMDSELLAGMFQHIADQSINLHSLLIVRNGSLVTEAYFQPYQPDQPQFLASVTKSVISTLVGIAIQEGYIKDTSQPLVNFFPDRHIANLDDAKKAITLKHLLTLSAGLKCNDAPFSGEVGMEQSQDWVQFMLDAPMAEPPGTKFNYCGGAVHLLSAVLQKTTRMAPRDFANQYLFKPLGIPAVPKERWLVDPQGLAIGPYGLYLTPRDLAKLGYLYLQNGRWEDQQILPPDWVKDATSPQTTKDNGLKYGYLWTVDPDQGSYSALGLAGQQIYVVPAKHLVIVFTGCLPSYGTDMDFIPLKTLVDKYILPAAQSDQALQANAAAVAKIQGFITKAAHPEQIAPAIPEGAQQWSGQVYTLEPNPNQWETIAFTPRPDAGTVDITINGQVVDPPLGLDQVYRVQQQSDVFAPLALRGAWQDASTLAIQAINLGELNDIDFQVHFAPDRIELTGKRVVNNEAIKITGVRRP